MNETILLRAAWSFSDTQCTLPQSPLAVVTQDGSKKPGWAYHAIGGFGRNNVDLTINRRFHFREEYELEFVANLTNALNHTQFISTDFNSGIGANVTPDPATGLKPGMNSNTNFGTYGLSTYEPRQVTFNLRLRF
jgi:hypothetical protein